jgi:hypothetical protein
VHCTSDVSALLATIALGLMAGALVAEGALLVPGNDRSGGCSFAAATIAVGA